MATPYLHHINIDTAKPDETIGFYENVLGLVNRPDRRPPSLRPGAWLFADDRPIVHLHFVDQIGTDGTGAFNHVAFGGVDFDATKQHLDGLDVSYVAKEQPEMRQLFFTDPNGISIEMNFEPEP